MISCPHCRNHLNDDPALAGQLVICPYCTIQFQWPIYVGGYQPQPGEGGTPFASNHIPQLQQPPPFEAQAGNPYAAYSVPAPAQYPAPFRQYVPDKKSAGLAAVLSFFWPGVGQIYNGHIAKGLLFMFVWPLVLWGSVAAVCVAASRGGNRGTIPASVALIGGIILWIVSLVWVIYDAHNCAEKINNRHRQRYG